MIRSWSLISFRCERESCRGEKNREELQKKKKRERELQRGGGCVVFVWGDLIVRSTREAVNSARPKAGPTKK